MPENKYVIKKGDSLWGIATRNGLTLQELMNINGITDTKYHLEPGATLLISKSQTITPGDVSNIPAWTPNATAGSVKGCSAQQYNPETGQWEKSTNCARWANDALRQFDGRYNGKHVTGDAWTRLRRGRMVFSGYTDDYDKTVFSEEASDLRNHTAADNLKDNFKVDSLDPAKTYMVNMYYDTSPSKQQAWEEARAGTTGTHTGNLYYDSKSGSWKVAHNVHGTIVNDDFSKVLGSRTGKGYGITAIAEAQARNNNKGLFNKIQGVLYDIGILKDGGKLIPKVVTDNISKVSPFIGLDNIIGKNYRSVPVYVLDKKDKYKQGGIINSKRNIRFGLNGLEEVPNVDGGSIAATVVFPKKTESAWDNKSALSRIGSFVEGNLERIVSNPEESYIRLNDYTVDFEDVNKPKLWNNRKIIGNIFINSKNPNTVGTPDSFYDGQSLGDDNVNANRYSRWMGVQNGRFVVGEKNAFDQNTLITPVVNKDIPITSTIDNTYNFGSIGKKFIIYSGDGSNAVSVTSNDKIRDINRFISENNISEDNPAHLIQLDSGRYATGITSDPSQYVRNDVPRKDRIWGFTIR